MTLNRTPFSYGLGTEVHGMSTRDAGTVFRTRQISSERIGTKYPWGIVSFSRLGSHMFSLTTQTEFHKSLKRRSGKDLDAFHTLAVSVLGIRDGSPLLSTRSIRLRQF